MCMRHLASTSTILRLKVDYYCCKVLFEFHHYITSLCQVITCSAGGHDDDYKEKPFRRAYRPIFACFVFVRGF